MKTFKKNVLALFVVSQALPAFAEIGANWSDEQKEKFVQTGIEAAVLEQAQTSNRERVKLFLLTNLHEGSGGNLDPAISTRIVDGMMDEYDAKIALSEGAVIPLHKLLQWGGAVGPKVVEALFEAPDGSSTRSKALRQVGAGTVLELSSKLFAPLHDTISEPDRLVASSMAFSDHHRAALNMARSARVISDCNNVSPQASNYNSCVHLLSSYGLPRGLTPELLLQTFPGAQNRTLAALNDLQTVFDKQADLLDQFREGFITQEQMIEGIQASVKDQFSELSEDMRLSFAGVIEELSGQGAVLERQSHQLNRLESKAQQVLDQVGIIPGQVSSIIVAQQRKAEAEAKLQAALKAVYQAQEGDKHAIGQGIVQAISLVDPVQGKKAESVLKAFNEVKLLNRRFKSTREAARLLNSVDPESFPLSNLASAGAYSLVFGYVGVAISLYQAFAEPGASTDALILEQIQQLRQAVEEFRAEMHQRLDAIDQRLDFMLASVTQNLGILIEQGSVNQTLIDESLELLSSTRGLVLANTQRILDALNQGQLEECELDPATQADYQLCAKRYESILLDDLKEAQQAIFNSAINTKETTARLTDGLYIEQLVGHLLSSRLQEGHAPYDTHKLVNFTQLSEVARKYVQYLLRYSNSFELPQGHRFAEITSIVANLSVFTSAATEAFDNGGKEALPEMLKAVVSLNEELIGETTAVIEESKNDFHVGRNMDFSIKHLDAPKLSFDAPESPQESLSKFFRYTDDLPSEEQDWHTYGETYAVTPLADERLYEVLLSEQNIPWLSLAERGAGYFYFMLGNRWGERDWIYHKEFVETNSEQGPYASYYFDLDLYLIFRFKDKSKPDQPIVSWNVLACCEAKDNIFGRSLEKWVEKSNHSIEAGEKSDLEFALDRSATVEYPTADELKNRNNPYFFLNYTHYTNRYANELGLWDKYGSLTRSYSGLPDSMTQIADSIDAQRVWDDYHSGFKELLRGKLQRASSTSETSVEIALENTLISQASSIAFGSATQESAFTHYAQQGELKSHTFEELLTYVDEGNDPSQLISLLKTENESLSAAAISFNVEIPKLASTQQSEMEGFVKWLSNSKIILEASWSKLKNFVVGQPVKIKTSSKSNDQIFSLNIATKKDGGKLSSLTIEQSGLSVGENLQLVADDNANGYLDSSDTTLMEVVVTDPGSPITLELPVPYSVSSNSHFFFVIKNQ